MPFHSSVAPGGDVQDWAVILALLCPQGALTPLAVTKHLSVGSRHSSQPARSLDVLFSWSAKAVHAAIDLRDNITCFQVYEAINSPAY